jgi:hypothetical protein
MASCRACGCDLQPMTMCPACEEDVQWRCVSCNKETDTSIHSHGGYIPEPVDINADAARTPTFAAAT